MCTYVYGHKLNYLQGMIENAKIEKPLCRNILTLFPLRGKVCVSLHLGGLMTAWINRIHGVHDFHDFQGWVRKGHGNCHPVFLVGALALGDVCCNVRISPILTLPCQRGRRLALGLTASVYLPANSQCQLPAMQMNHVGWPA